MPKDSKTKTAKNRVKVGKLPTTKTKLTGKEMKRVKAGAGYIKFDGIDGEIVARKKPIGTT